MRLNNKIHISWLVATLCVGLLIGAFAALYNNSFTGLEWIVFALCLVALSLVKRNAVSIFLALVAGVLLGLWRAGSMLQSQGAFQEYFGDRVKVTGQISEDVTIDTDGDIRFKLDNVSIEGRLIDGSVWVSTPDQANLKRSDSVTVSGFLDAGFGTIPAALYRVSVDKVERSTHEDVGREVRDWFAEGIRRSIDEPEASLGSGFLLGQKSALPEKLDNELRLLGLTHIVVASGYNLTILIRFVRRFFEKISRFSSLALSGMLIFGFAQITGFSPSMSRASLIASLSLLAWYYGRKFHPFVLLPFSAAVTVWINPSYAWGDIGWLLSFAAFIGVIVVSPLIHAYFWGEQKAGPLRQVCIETLSAQIVTVPIVAYMFGQFSVLSLLANVLVVPFIPLAMALIFVGGLVGVSVYSIAWLFGRPAQLVLNYMTWVVDKLAALPNASTEVNVGITRIVLFYVLLFLGIVFLWRRTGYKFREYNIIE